MGHMSADEVQRFADADWACRTCHRWIKRGAPHAVADMIVNCADGFVAVPYRYHAACAPAGAVPVAAAA